jgi:secreted PhoX family phosphatase
VTSLDRRSFLRRGGALTAGALTLGGPMQALLARRALAAGSTGVALDNSGYGPLRPTRDIVTGEHLLDLPEGFLYRSFGRTGEIMSDGVPTPGSHDGMAAFEYGSQRFVRLVRNHERRGGGAFGDTTRAYDAKAGGGTTTIELGPHPASPPLASWVSLNGTNVNCAGGLTPWGSWITCEENINGPDLPGAGSQTYDRKHGYVFEVPSARNPHDYTVGRPIRSAGRFQHEAVAFDPATGTMYQTEDPFGDGIGGFYRYVPPVKGRLDDGGTLEMLSVSPAGSTASADLRSGQAQGVTYAARWVRIPDPDPTFTGSENVDVKAVFSQGAAQGAARFNRLEGAWYADGRIFFTSTQGGDARRGQVWAFDVAAQTLTLVFESPGEATLDLPDNITVSPRGSLLLCEDGGGVNYIRGLTLDGRIFDFARNAVAGFEGQEFAGACFSPRGHTLYVNIQTPGITFGIWGPWGRGAL